MSGEERAGFILLCAAGLGRAGAREGKDTAVDGSGSGVSDRIKRVRVKIIAEAAGPLIL